MQVYVTMYLNDVQRSFFYESLGLNTKQFDMHVIIEVNGHAKADLFLSRLVDTASCQSNGNLMCDLVPPGPTDLTEAFPKERIPSKTDL